MTERSTSGSVILRNGSKDPDLCPNLKKSGTLVETLLTERDLFLQVGISRRFSCRKFMKAFVFLGAIVDL
jgi:hypothetical protein